ncbi:hypothetical protein AK812_SmicGene31998 [Symbiodinium microadriaticum]|uniref:Uncharacterized protein n=1 Tax=Symbiodinium microadriaticum TaxID=2951 RepID=A0A1Q9CV89_SYMMI|nr:hypothetical protein AK812_SmicGene31998 [Symbiodinium microadriaticum]
MLRYAKRLSFAFQGVSTAFATLQPSSSLGAEGVGDGKEVVKVTCTFTDKALLETGHLRADLEDLDLGGRHLNLLCCETSSTNLKACVCRLIIADEDIGQNGQATVLADGLMQLLWRGAPFLVTYACAALVNLCQGHVVRSHLIHNDVIPLCKHNIRTYDNDLVLYSLMVLVRPDGARSNHRASVERYGMALSKMGVVAGCVRFAGAMQSKAELQGLLEFCTGLLHSLHAQTETRWRVLAELCNILGQLFADEASREAAAAPESQVFDFLMTLMESSVSQGVSPLPDWSVKLQSKVLLALRSLCQVSAVRREQVCDHVSKPLPKLMSALGNQAVLLCSAMSTTREHLVDLKEAGWEQAYPARVMSTCQTAAERDLLRERMMVISNAIATLAVQSLNHLNHLAKPLRLGVGGSRLLADLRPAARRMPLYEEKFICPFSIRFSQARIRPTFQDGREVEASMEQISAVSCPEGPLQQRYDVLLRAPFPPIEIIRWWPKLREEDGETLLDENGKTILGEPCWFTFDNRRLYCLQAAAIKNWPSRTAAVVHVMHDLPVSKCAPKKFRTTDLGCSVRISRRDDVVPKATWTWMEVPIETLLRSP